MGCGVVIGKHIIHEHASLLVPEIESDVVPVLSTTLLLLVFHHPAAWLGLSAPSICNNVK